MLQSTTKLQTKPFTCNFPLRHKVVRSLKIVTEKVGELEVSGTCYVDKSVPKTDVFERYAVDIDFVRWNGTDIKLVLEVTGGMEDIEEHAIRQMAAMAEEEARYES